MIRWKTLPVSAVFLASVPAVRAADKLGVQPELSPGGRWLAVLFESLREVPSRSGREGKYKYKEYERTGQWGFFRVDLAAEKPEPDLLERQIGLEPGSDGPTHDDAAIDDEGVVFALRNEAPQLVRWDAKLERTEKRLFRDERGFVEMHLRPDGKEMVVYRQLLDGVGQRTEAYRYDLSSAGITRWAALDGFMDDEIHWSRDLKHLFATEAAGKKGERDSYRLMRVDVATGERKAVAERVWLDGNCFVGAWVTLQALCDEHEKAGKHAHPFLRISTSEPFDLVEVTELADRWPILAIDDDRVLCRGDDSSYAIASVTRGRPQTLRLPPGELLHSRSLESFVVFPEGRESECEVRGHDGKLIKKVRFDLKAPVRKAK